MTDTSNREELIEEAAKAISDKSWKGFAHGESFPEAYARIALGVFEQAHTSTECHECHRADGQHKLGCGQRRTPTDDEREAARAYADAEYPELRLAPENEDRADIAERAFLAGSRFRRTVQGAEGPEWEYGVLFADYRTEPTFVGAEDSARYFIGRPNDALDKNALPDDRKVLVRRRKAGPWEAVPAAESNEREEQG